EIVQLGADGFSGRRIGRRQQRQERPVAAAVVEDALPVELPRETQAGLEAPAMAPRDQAVLAENLLGGVVALTERLVTHRCRRSRRLRGQNFFARASQLPRSE